MLFPSQEKAKNKVLEYLNGKDNRPGIVVGPTGFGKSYLISAVANEYKEPILVLQPNKELLEQNLGKLELMGGKATVYSASVGVKEASELTYATLGSIKNKVEVFKKLGVKTILVDECDHGYSPKEGSMFKKFINKLKPEKIVGYTATPFSLGVGYNKFGESYSVLKMLNRQRPRIFKHFIDVVQIQDVIRDGRWSPLVYITHDFDTNELKFNTSGTEFTEQSVKKAVEAQGVNNNIYLRLKTLLKDPTKNILVFVDCVENGEKMASLFKEAAFIGGETNKKERTKIINSFRNPKGKIRAVINHTVLTVGFDYPELNHIMLGRPTNSLRLLYQKIGRGVRIHENKEKCYIEDFCGNIDRFGYVENLTIEDYPGYGWGIFNGDVLLTGVPLDAPVKTTKKTLDEGQKDLMKIWFGKYKGTPLNQLSKRYLVYLAEWIDSLDKPSKNLIGLRSKIKNLMGV